MFREKKSFFDKLTGMINNQEEGDNPETQEEGGGNADNQDNWVEENVGEGQLSIDVYQNPSEIIIQAMVAGVKPDDLEISISREMVTIKGKREQSRAVAEDDFFFQELYWGAFSRTIVLPEEVDVEESEASGHHGLLTIRLPKIDRKKTQTLKVKSR